MKQFALLMILPLAACGGGEAPADVQASEVAAEPPAVGIYAGLGVGIEGEELGITLSPLVEVPELEYRPLYPGKDEPEQATVAAFLLEEHAVTNSQFLAFVAANPQWRRSQIAAVFADDRYLASWPEDLAISPGSEDSPVIEVSWFAARAYATWIGRRLPTLAEWEASAAASETSAYGREEEEFSQRILDWYGRPMPTVPPTVRSTFQSFHGLWDMHGLVWEWVEDYNSALVTGESRGDSALDRQLFCGSGSLGVADPTDYAAFMRFAYRSSLQANYTVGNLGFRCAADAPTAPAPCCAPIAEASDNPLPEESIQLLSASFTSGAGDELTLADFRGQPTVIAMMFTNCEYACPRIIADLKGIEAALEVEEREALNWVLISFDTARDTPEVLAAYAEQNSLDPSRWTLLHGGSAEVREVAAALGVQYKLTPTGAFAHSNRITVLDADGVRAGALDGLGVPAEEGTALIRTVLQ